MKRCDVLLILGVPPPWGGGEICAQIMQSHFCELPGCRIFSYARKRGNKSTQGRFNLSNLGFGIFYIIKCIWLILRYRPRRMFISIPKNFGAFLRMIPVILFASAMRVNVFGELAGARFLFLDKAWQRSIGLFVLRRLHSIHFLGDRIRSAHDQYGFKNPSVFSNGVRIPDDRSSKATERPLTLLYVGALNRSKGVVRVIEALRLCRQAGMEVTCVLMGEWGDPALKPEMEAYIKQHQLQEFILFTGLVSGEAKWDYFRKASILVHPTEWDGQPLTILEAIGMGLAVISTHVGSIPDTVVHGKNGFLLDKNSSEDLCETIHRLYEDRSELKQIMEYNGRDFDVRFSVTTYLKNIQRWLETV